MLLCETQLKYSVSSDSFPRRNLSKDTHDSLTLVTYLPLESHLICVQEKPFIFCIHLFTELIEQMPIKGMYFDVVNNFNQILQNTVKLS